MTTHDVSLDSIVWGEHVTLTCRPCEVKFTTTPEVPQDEAIAGMDAFFGAHPCEFVEVFG